MIGITYKVATAYVLGRDFGQSQPPREILYMQTKPKVNEPILIYFVKTGLGRFGKVLKIRSEPPKRWIVLSYKCLATGAVVDLETDEIGAA